MELERGRALRRGGCDHLDCHRGPFLVVFAGTTTDEKTFTCVYSSEDDSWGEPIYARRDYGFFELGNSILIGGTLHFKLNTRILEYDLLTQKMSSVRLPRRTQQRTVLMATTEDGGLGFAVV